jgi:3-methyl-2-oxobutanoate hydroxymethyltransferase
MQQAGERIAMVTAYDASSALLAAQAGIDCLLVGDSLGMVVQGHDSTLPVTLDALRYHVDCVARGMARAAASQPPTRPWLIADLPFGSYGGSLEATFAHACSLMQAGAQMVKLEGGGWTVPLVEWLVARGIPVCAHLGLTPQHVHALGGYRLQGRTPEAASVLMQQARDLQQAGAGLLVLEMVPAALAREVTEALTGCPTIGIGAGAGTAGQVLVLHDLLGITPGPVPRFVRNFLSGNPSVQAALSAYVAAVKDGTFPVDAQHAW